MNEKLDLTTEENVVSYMEAATSEADWNARLEDVKRANMGYPAFWFEAIVLSGVAHKTAAKFGGSAEIKIVRLS